MNSNGLPNWRDGSVPHEDVQRDQISEALFAVNLSRAMMSEGTAEYRDPTLFYERTHLTRTLKSLIEDVLKTLLGDPGTNSVIHLQTNFGGGKSHAELAIYHLLKSPEKVMAVPQMAQLLRNVGFDVIPRAAVAALPCANLFPGGRDVEQGLTIRTLWGELAYHLDNGNLDLYRLIQRSDEMLISPGVDLLHKLLVEAGPNVILIDEMLHYIDKAAAVTIGGSNLASQTVAFLRELTEAVDSIPHSILIASLTASRMEDITVLSQEEAEFTLSKLEDTMRRLEDSRTPVESSEIYDIVRMRLFKEVDLNLVAKVASHYTSFYRTEPWKDLLPQGSRDADYEETLAKAFPFHPSVIKVLYERWGSRPQFQLTRGTLRFLSHLLAHLWKNHNRDKAVGALIHLSDVDLSDEDVRAEAIQVAGSNWESVIGTDIASVESGGVALAQRQDRERGGLYARYGLVQGTATTVFMFTHGGQQSKPTPPAEVRLAVAQPALPFPDVRQALDDCHARLYYYYEEEEGYLFKTEPNPNKVLADERLNVDTDVAREKVAEVVPEVLGPSGLFNVSYFGFGTSSVQESVDVPDDGSLQLVVLPPRFAVSKGRIEGRTKEIIHTISENYGKQHRMNRNMLLVMVPDSEFIANAIERAMDWKAAENVVGTADLMNRFTESQQAAIRDRITTTSNDAKDHVRRAYNTVVMPAGIKNNAVEHEVFELSYVPPGKKVLPQAEEELKNKPRLHESFNPALFNDRWASLWPKTATVITTSALWEKFARRPGSPILTSSRVLEDTILRGVDGEIFGYGILLDGELDKLKPKSYTRMYLGHFDAQDLGRVAISSDAILVRREQVESLFPPITKEEVAMLLRQPKQQVETTFWQARKSDTVQGRVDQQSFFRAICEGVKSGLFGYAESTSSPAEKGSEVRLSPEDIRFSGILVGEDTPIPVSASEVARLIPAEGRVAVSDLYQAVLDAYGLERATEQSFREALKHCVQDSQFGYASDRTAPIQYSSETISLDGYIGRAEALRPDARLIRLHGPVTAVELASVIKTVNMLSKLGNSTINLDLRIELRGDMNEHSVAMAINELKNRVVELNVEDSAR